MIPSEYDQARWDSAILERCHTLSRDAMFTVALQCRRVQQDDPMDEVFVFRRWSDYKFLILALWQLRTTVRIACKVRKVAKHINAAISRFDTSLPDLEKLRHVEVHIDEYAVDNGFNKQVSRIELEVGEISASSFVWLGFRLERDEALKAAEALYESVLHIIKSYREQEVLT